MANAHLRIVVASAEEAIKDVKSGSTILAGGFGLCGTSDTLINAIEADRSIQNLTVVSNNAGIENIALGKLLATGQIKKMISSYVGENKVFEQLYLTGKIELELTPQGTLAERCRAGGAGIPAFYTPAGAGTWVESGKLPVRYNADGTVGLTSAPREAREFNGRKYIMEEAITGDFAFIKAWRADKLGNCQFRYAAANFNGPMARAGKITIVEADEIVEVGEIEPNFVHLPGIYVTRVIKAAQPNGIERLKFAPEEGSASDSSVGSTGTVNKRDLIIKRAAKEFKDGMYVNLGIGMPILAPNFVDPSISVQLQTENGILGLGPYPQPGQQDTDLVNAGKETVTLNTGACTFTSDESFGMIRSGRIDLTLLGAMQCSQYGDIASWSLPGKIKGMGGAMDLVSNPTNTKVVVTMEHCDKKGNTKILPSKFPP